MKQHLFALVVARLAGAALLYGHLGFAATFIVSNTSDSGAGSLRQAILDANRSAGPDEITFNIGAGGVAVISPASELPAVTGTVTIDGRTQPGYTGNPLIELNGSRTPARKGLIINASGCAVHGLSIHSFGAMSGAFTEPAGGQIYVDRCSDTVIQDNLLGLNAAGFSSDVGNWNCAGIVLDNAFQSQVGGLGFGRNVISGNRGDGVLITGESAKRNVIEGNYIGTDTMGRAAATRVISGPVWAGVRVFNASQNLIGGAGPDARNIISGNLDAGIHLEYATANQICGNFIGTDVTGTRGLANLGDGVTVDGSEFNMIGGDTLELRNVIGANLFQGISIQYQVYSNLFPDRHSVSNVVTGNFIGTDLTGISPLGNGGDGISIGHPTTRHNFIIATNGIPNVIGFNGESGVIMYSSQNVLAGNLVLENGVLGILSSSGIYAIGNSNIILGNVVQANIGNGIMLHGNANETIENDISYNRGNGVCVVVAGVDNVVRRNSIYKNAGLGIDLNDDGVTLNDSRAGDADTGPNTRQNFPVLTRAISDGFSIALTGKLDSSPNTRYLIDFYSNEECDPTGYGEGHYYFGQCEVTTDASGIGRFSGTFWSVEPVSLVITATATSPSRNTSEFSPCTAVEFRPR